MNILGYDLNVNLGGIMGTMTNYLMWFLVVTFFLAIIGWWIWSYYKKKSYNIPITLLRKMENGIVKENTNIMGGIVGGKGGVRNFKAKIKGSWKKHELGYMPDLGLADGNGRLTFMTHGDGTLWQQVRKVIVTEKEVEVPEGTDEQGNVITKKVRYSLLLEPIPTEVKQVTLNNIQAVRNVMEKNKMTTFAIGMAAFVIMGIVHLVSLYIQTKIRCPTP